VEQDSQFREGRKIVVPELMKYGSRPISIGRPLSLAGGVIGVGLLALPAFAQDAGNVHELQRIIEAQQRQLDAQQKQLDAQRQLLRELQSQIESLPKNEDKKTVTVIAEKPPAKPPADSITARPQKDDELSEAGKYDQDSPSGTNFTYYAPAANIEVPGTNTNIGVHGIVEFQMFHDTVGLNNNRFDTASIPVDGAPAQTKFSVNPTRIGLSSTTPVPEGQVNTMVSMDFNGQLDRPEPRLRIAYGEYVSDDLGLAVLGGQAYATMLDLKAAPETLDFAGPAGLWQQRQPLLRFTKSIAGGMMAEVAFETPENVSYVNATKLSRWPDLAVAGTWFAGGEYIKHFRLAGLARDLGAEGAAGSTDSTLGWAVTGSAKLGLPFLGAKDSLKFTLHYGDGYGTQVKGGPPEGVFDDRTSQLETIGIFSSYGGIQHFWSERFRSNLVGGFVNADNPTIASADALENTQYVAVDFIWAPSKTSTFGVEYLWGRRENKDGASGTANRLLFSSIYTF
jgi:hypothetical protein